MRILYSDKIDSAVLQKEIDNINLNLYTAVQNIANLEDEHKNYELLVKGLIQSTKQAISRLFINSDINFTPQKDTQYFNVPLHSGNILKHSNIEFLDSGGIYLKPKKIINRIPMKDGKLTDDIKILIFGSLPEDYDQTLTHYIFTDNNVWIYKNSTQTLQLDIRIEPTLTSDFNFLAFETLFPLKNSHKLTPFTDKLPVALTDLHQDNDRVYNQLFENFSGRLLVDLKSYFRDSNGKYIFGIDKISLLKNEYVESGEVILSIETQGKNTIKHLEFTGNFEYLDLHVQLFSDADLKSKLFDSTYDTLPFDGTIKIPEDTNTLFIRIVLNKSNGNTPFLKSAIIGLGGNN